MFELTHRTHAEKISLKDLPALRQAFAVGAIFIIVGIGLGVTVSEYFLVLPLLVSFGLSLSAFLGVCPMASILERMPWNR